MSFDLAIAVDTAPYLTPQLYLMVDSIRDKLPKDTIVHIVTDRQDNDECLQWIQKQVPTIIYKDDGSKTNHLKSRCRYMLNVLDIESDKEWVMKIESDFIFLKHLSEYEKLLEDDLDLVIETESRKIYPDNIEKRLWRQMYRAMGYQQPTQKVRFRENNEEGLALFGTGLFCVKNKHIKWLSDEWIRLTEKAEPWLSFNVHSNEQALTCAILNSDLKWKIYPPKYKWNPISFCRDGEFPNTNLKPNCIIPMDCILFDYHRPKWLMHISKYNPQVADIICRNSKYIPKEWWKLDSGEFMEK